MLRPALFRINVAVVIAVSFLSASQRSLVGDDEVEYTVMRIPPKFETRIEVVKVTEGLDPADDAGAKRIVAQNKSALGKMRGQVRGILEGKGTFDEVLVNGYFEKILFAEMTQTSDEDFEQLPKRRQDFFTQFVYRAAPSMHTHLVNNITLPRMQQIVENKTFKDEEATWHPAVRYNAMLIIGRLNSAEAVTRGNVKLPVAHAGARAYMLDKFTDPALDDGIRVAALLGLLRHAELDGQLAAGERMDGKQKRDIINAMKDVIDAPPGNRTPEGHAWLQRRAIQVLGALRDPGAVEAETPVGGVAALLMGIINDESKRMSYRCAAAAAYGKLVFPPSAKFDKVRAVDDLARIAVKACQDELEFMKFQLDKLAEETGPVRGGRPVAVAPEAQVTELSKYQLDRSRRAIKFPVDCIQNAIGKNDRSGARRAITDQAQKTYADTLAKSLYQLYQATNVGMKKDDATPTQSFEQAVSRRLQDVQKTLATSPSKPAPKPPEEAEKTEDKKEDTALPPGLK